MKLIKTELKAKTYHLQMEYSPLSDVDFRASLFLLVGYRGETEHLYDRDYQGDVEIVVEELEEELIKVRVNDREYTTQDLIGRLVTMMHHVLTKDIYEKIGEIALAADLHGIKIVDPQLYQHIQLYDKEKIREIVEEKIFARDLTGYDAVIYPLDNKLSYIKYIDANRDYILPHESAEAIAINPYHIIKRSQGYSLNR